MPTNIINPLTNKIMKKSLTYNDLEVMCMRTTLHKHHCATQRGYICKGYDRVDEYEGKFGKGYIYHYENCKTSIDNSYHYIEYFIY